MEVTAKYRKDLERLEEEYYKRKKAENSQIQTVKISYINSL